MRFRNHIEEGYNPHRGLMQKGIELVYTHCMPFIKDLVKGRYNYLTKNQDLLHSGRKGSDPIIKKNIRTNRKPSDMDMDLYNYYDKTFYKKFGIKGRSGSLFCSGDSHMAGGYGDTNYIVFPVGKYEILWSDEIRDLYKNPYSDMIIDRYLNIYYDQRILMLDDPSINPDVALKKYPYDFFSTSDTYSIKKEFNKTMDEKIFSTYQTGNLMKAIDSHHEIMMQSKGFVGLKWIDFNAKIKIYIETMGTTFPDDDVFNKWYETYF